MKYDYISDILEFGEFNSLLKYCFVDLFYNFVFRRRFYCGCWKMIWGKCFDFNINISFESKIYISY